MERSVARHSGATAAELPLLQTGAHGIPYSPQRVAGAPFDQYLEESGLAAVASFRHREDA